MMKISEWLEKLDGHDILTFDDAVSDFEKETGLKAEGWQRTTAADMRAALEIEGRGGYLEGDTDVIPALELSDMFAVKLAGYYSDKWGRGFRHRDNILALQRIDK